MKRVAILVVVDVADDTPEKHLLNLSAAVSAQADDPVGDWDEHGNEVAIDSSGNSVILLDEEEWRVLVDALAVGLEGANPDDRAADELYTAIQAADAQPLPVASTEP